MKHERLLIGLLLLVPFFGTSQPAEKVSFSVSGGFYETSPVLELYPFYQNHHIRFTTNGNRPTAQSRLYTEPLLLDGNLYSTSDIYTIQTAPEEQMFYPESVQHCIVIRAAVFDENDSCVSQVVTNSYFIQSLGCDTHGLPAVSLCADSLDLFDYYNGILVPGVYFSQNTPNWTGNYYQSGEAWERLANVEFYELDDNSGINQLAGLRTHGGNARRGSQKGLKIYAREEYGKKRFQHRFFQSLPNESFKHLVLKPFTDQWFWAGIQNMICQKMAGNINVESLAVRPSVLFLNGEYWGIYSVCERPDAHYLEDHFGHNDQDYNLMGNWEGECENGSDTNFKQMMSWLQDNTLSDPDNYEYLCSLIDLNCFIDYYCLELFIANTDWPANNMRCYQYHDGKWRWIFYDGDNGLREMDFDVLENASSIQDLGWPNNLISTLMFRRLLENDSFVTQFASRFHQLMNNQFSYSHTKPYFDLYSTMVRAEVPEQCSRFNRPRDLNHWEYLIAAQNDFLRLRVEDMNNKLSQFLSVGVNYLDHGMICSPNPSNGSMRLVINSDMESESQLQIFDVVGRQVFCQTVNLTNGYNTIVLNPTLDSGIYVIRIGGNAMKIVRQ